MSNPHAPNTGPNWTPITTADVKVGALGTVTVKDHVDHDLHGTPIGTTTRPDAWSHLINGPHVWINADATAGGMADTHENALAELIADAHETAVRAWEERQGRAA